MDKGRKAHAQHKASTDPEERKALDLKMDKYAKSLKKYTD